MCIYIYIYIMRSRTEKMSHVSPLGVEVEDVGVVVDARHDLPLDPHCPPVSYC